MQVIISHEVDVPNQLGHYSVLRVEAVTHEGRIARTIKQVSTHSSEVAALARAEQLDAELG
jgi:hypothetical protein